MTATWRISTNAILMTTGALALLAACETPVDFDLRDIGNGFDTTEAVQNLPNRPRPDDRGVISYPNYQVVLARQGDTITTVSQRLGLDAGAVARFNGVAVDAPLRRDEVIALPGRVTEPSAATGAAPPRDITSVATTALDRAGPQQVSTRPIATPATPATQSGTEPVRHRVARGETVFSISRLYNVPVRNIADWNALGTELTVREGQFLLIPQNGATRPASAVTPAPAAEPGTGSVTPVPPSATTPLPDENPSAPLPAAATPAAPDIGTTAPAPAASNARLAYPVQGNIIRAYTAGRNEGIDIGVAAGTPVKAADAGSVAAVTTDTSGVAIVVIKHADNLLTVYTNLEGLSVAKNDTVSRGQTIAKVRAGDPSFLHFEVRRGLQSVDPADFLP